MWNLVPTFKNINSSKSDKLLNYNRYIDDFCDMQYMATTYILEKGKQKKFRKLYGCFQNRELPRIFKVQA